MKSFLDQLAFALALATGLFVILLAGVLGFNEVHGKISTLVNSRQVVRLHDELRRQPKDETLKQHIRQLDLQLRQETFYRLSLSHNATRALLGGLVLFLLSAHWTRTRRQRSPDPLAWGARKPEQERRNARWAQVGVAAGIAFVALAAVLASPGRLPEPLPVEIPASDEEYQQAWPAFRGPTGAGNAADANVTLPWTIRWKTPVPLPGMSSPVIWSNSVFLTGASATEDRVFRLDADTGKLLWSAVVPGPKPPAPKATDDTGLAAPTAVTDGRRVYALFPDGMVGAFDFTGKPVWSRNIGPLDNSYGYAASPALYRDRLLIQIDRGDAEEGQSKLLALDTRTGRDFWEVKRPVAGSWTSPVIVARNGQPELLTCANPFVIAYNPVDGAELWRVKCLSDDCAPSPVMVGNVVIAIAPNNAVFGVQPGTTNVLWRMDEGVPDAPSPVSDEQRCYFIDPNGLLTCLHAATGKSVWTHELGEHFYASPTIAGGTLILLSRKGVAQLLATGESYRLLGKFEFGEECNASPVPRGRRLYVRGKYNLFCVESAAK